MTTGASPRARASRSSSNICMRRRDQVGADEPARVLVAADQRHLRHDALHAPVDRAHDERVRAAVARAPDPDPVAVDLVARAGVGDRVPVVAHLRPRVDLLPRLAVGRAQVAVVVDQRAEPGLAEHLGERVEEELLDRAVAVAHHDRRRRARRLVGDVQPPPQRRALGVELDVLPHLGSPPVTRSPACSPAARRAPTGDPPPRTRDPQACRPGRRRRPRGRSGRGR